MAAEGADRRQAQALIDRYIYVDPYERGPSDARVVGYGTPVWALVGYYFGEAEENAAQVAADYDLPLDAVRAALAYFEAHREPIGGRILVNAAA